MSVDKPGTLPPPTGGKCGAKKIWIMKYIIIFIFFLKYLIRRLFSFYNDIYKKNGEKYMPTLKYTMYTHRNATTHVDVKICALYNTISTV